MPLSPRAQDNSQVNSHENASAPCSRHFKASWSSKQVGASDWVAEEDEGAVSALASVLLLPDHGKSWEIMGKVRVRPCAYVLRRSGEIA